MKKEITSSPVDAVEYPNYDELTAAMHTEFEVDQETDFKHRVWAAQSCLDRGLYKTVEHALPWFSLTLEHYNRYKDSYPG